MAETIAARSRQLVNGVLHPLGLHLARRSRAFEMDDLLAAMVRRRQQVKTWIDVGASDGKWSLRTRKYFPEANYILFEPLSERAAALARLHKQEGFLPIYAAAGSRPGTANFSVDAALDGSAVTTANDISVREVKIETIDRAVKSSGWPGPFGIKLDTHGYELPILDGATETLVTTSLIIIEAYNFRLSSSALRFPELCLELERRGFRVCDLADPMRRPTDDAFWQFDLAFAPATASVFQSNLYNTPVTTPIPGATR